MKKPLCSLLLLLPAFSFAEISASITPVSEYRSYGRSQTDKNPALQGTVNFVHKSGFYYKNWWSTMSLASGSEQKFELDTYFGFAHAFNSDFSIDLGVAPYLFFGSSAAADINYEDFYVTAAYKNSSLTTYYAPEYIGNSDSHAYRLELNHSIPMEDYRLGLHAAHTHRTGKVRDAYDGSSQYGYNYVGVSAAKEWHGYTWLALATATDITKGAGHDNAKPALVLKVTKAWSF